MPVKQTAILDSRKVLGLGFAHTEAAEGTPRAQRFSLGGWNWFPVIDKVRRLRVLELGRNKLRIQRVIFLSVSQAPWIM